MDEERRGEKGGRDDIDVVECYCMDVGRSTIIKQGKGEQVGNFKQPKTSYKPFLATSITKSSDPHG